MGRKNNYISKNNKNIIFSSDLKNENLNGTSVFFSLSDCLYTINQIYHEGELLQGRSKTSMIETSILAIFLLVGLNLEDIKEIKIKDYKQILKHNFSITINNQTIFMNTSYENCNQIIEKYINEFHLTDKIFPITKSIHVEKMRNSMNVIESINNRKIIPYKLNYNCLFRSKISLSLTYAKIEILYNKNYSKAEIIKYLIDNNYSPSLAYKIYNEFAKWLSEKNKIIF